MTVGDMHQQNLSINERKTERIPPVSIGTALDETQERMRVFTNEADKKLFLDLQDTMFNVKDFIMIELQKPCEHIDEFNPELLLSEMGALTDGLKKAQAQWLLPGQDSTAAISMHGFNNIITYLSLEEGRLQSAIKKGTMLGFDLPRFRESIAMSTGFLDSLIPDGTEVISIKRLINFYKDLLQGTRFTIQDYNTNKLIDTKALASKAAAFKAIFFEALWNSKKHALDQRAIIYMVNDKLRVVNRYSESALPAELPVFSTKMGLPLMAGIGGICVKPIDTFWTYEILEGKTIPSLVKTTTALRGVEISELKVLKTS